MSSMNVLELAQTEWALSIVFVPKERRPIRFCLNYRKVIAVSIRYFYFIACPDQSIEPHDSAALFSPCTLIVGIGKWNLLTKIAVRPLLHPITDYSDSLEWNSI